MRSLSRATAGAARQCQRPSRRADQTQLLQGCHAIIETDFLGNAPVLDAQDRGAAEAHFLARSCRQCAQQKIAERGSGMRATTVPAADHIIALGDQIGSPAEFKIGERGAKILHEISDVRTPAARRV